MSAHRCGRECAGHDPHFIQVHRATGWQPATITKVEDDDIHIRLHGGEERLVRNHDPERVKRLLRGNHTGCWISGSGSLISIDMGPRIVVRHLGDHGRTGGLRPEWTAGDHVTSRARR